MPAFVPPGFPETFERVWQIGQRALARLLPGARRVRARRSGHDVMLERARLVIREIRRVVAASRR